MPSLVGSFNPIVGPVLQVAIASLDELNAAQSAGGLPPSVRMYQALIDTGASMTCVTDTVVKDCALKPSGKTMMTGATGASATNQYAFAVGLTVGQRQDATGNVSADLLFKGVQGCEFHNPGGSFDILLGRDIICQGVFTMSFDGHFTLSF